MEKHARKLINFSKMFTCGDCSAVTNKGYQTVSENGTSFVCRSCYERRYAREYPARGQLMREIVPHEKLLSEEYDVNYLYAETTNSAVRQDDWKVTSQREATAEDDRYVQIDIPETPAHNTGTAATQPISDESETQSVDVRICNDHTVQILLPKEFIESNGKVIRLSVVLV